MTTRRTLSGKKIPREQHRPTWHELVQPPKPTEPKPRRSAHYDAMAALPTPESLAGTEFPETSRGGRDRRRHAAYLNDLALRLGVAFTAAREARHPRRVAKRNAIRQAKAAQAERRTAA